MKQVTVCICTFDRIKYLSLCLNSLANQTIGAEFYDVLIVDNNSVDKTRQLALSYCEKYSNFNYKLERKQGLSHARNAGLQLANSPWILYLDDDAIASSDLISQTIHIIKKGKYDVFGGPVLNKYQHDAPNWVKIEYGRYLDDFPQKEMILEKDYLKGSNLCFKKRIGIQIGGFDVSLGMHGDRLAYGEEDRLQNKMREAGYSIGYIPDMIVEHFVISEKYKLSWQINSIFSHGRDSIKVNNQNHKTRIIIFRMVRSFFAGLLKRLPIAIYQILLNRDYYWQNALLYIIKPIVLYLGKVRGLWK